MAATTSAPMPRSVTPRLSEPYLSSNQPATTSPSADPPTVTVVITALARALSSAVAIGGDRRFIDTFAFDGLCQKLRDCGWAVTRPQTGFLSSYLRLIALGAVALGLLLFWMI